MVKTLTLIAIALAVGGCATRPRGAEYVPLVDMKDKDQAVFVTDVRECQAYATQRMGAAEGAMAGAVAGALIGAIIAPRGYRNKIAGRTALLGAAGGAGTAMNTQEGITKQCLAGRGYNVLN